LGGGESGNDELQSKENVDDELWTKIEINMNQDVAWLVRMWHGL
jgi:hypothetical protein